MDVNQFRKLVRSLRFETPQEAIDYVEERIPDPEGFTPVVVVFPHLGAGVMTQSACEHLGFAMVPTVARVPVYLAGRPMYG